MIAVIISFFLGIITLHCFRELPNIVLLSFITLAATSVSLYVLIIQDVFKSKERCFRAEAQKKFRYRKQTLSLTSFNLSDYGSRFATKIRVLILAFIFGFLWVYWHAQNLIHQKIPDSIEKKIITVVGTIQQIPEWHQENVSLMFKINHLIPSSLWSNPGIVKIHWTKIPDNLKKTDLKVGDKWLLNLKLKQVHGYANPGGFDKERHFFLNKIVAEGSVVNHENNQLLENSVLSQPVNRVRTIISDKIQSVLRNSSFSGVINALVVGLQTGITKEQWQIFRNTGTAHLVAISGLHIGLSASFMYFLVKLWWKYFAFNRISIALPLLSGTLGLFAAILYALLAGFSIPTQRAVIMIAIFLVGILKKRFFSVWQSYCLALGLVVLINPLTTLSVGFWLSFGAVGILLFGMRGRIEPKGFWWRWGHAQWVVFIGLTPLTLLIFKMASVVSPIANIIAIPWISFLVVPFCLVGALLLSLNETLGGWLISSAEYLLSVIWPFLEYLSQLPALDIASESKPLMLYLLAMIGVLICLLPSKFPAKNLAVLWLFPLLMTKSTTVPINKAKVTVLDVGQGLATVVSTKNHVLVFDTGPKLGEGTDTGERVVLPFLASQGIDEIDTLMISHGDNDHMGGAQSIINNINVKQIISSEPHLFSHPSVRMCQAGQHWEWDGVRFDIIHPKALFSKKRNNHSCVLRVAAGEQSVLLTADIETKSEELIINEYNTKNNSALLKATVLLVPHHGSKTSSSIDFLKAVNPQLAIVPVGYKNSYGHPKPEIMLRYQQLAIPIRDTVHDGAISFILDPFIVEVQPSCFRTKNQRYWNFRGNRQC